MKFFFQKNNILLILIFIFIIKISSENEKKQLERYKNAIDLIISRTNGIIDTSLTFEYEKYNITFNNFNMLKPFKKNMNISKEIYNNEIFFNVGNVMTTIQADLFIQLFSLKDEKIKYKSIFFEIYFSEIKFKLINNFVIEFSSSNIESFIYNNSNNLEYFSDFNNKKICNFYEGEKQAIILEDIDSKLKEIFKLKFEDKIKELLINYNLLTYDMIYIFNNYEFSLYSEDISQYIFYLEPTKIKLDEEDINLNLTDNSISIKYFKLSGIYIYFLILDTYYHFEINCIRDKEHFNFKLLNGENVEMKFQISDCGISDDNTDFDTYSIEYFDDIKRIIQVDYIMYLKKKASQYYQEIFND